MTALDALLHFLSRRFPCWGACKIRFFPEERTLYIHCQTTQSRMFVIKDRFQLAALDIGLERLIITLPSHPDFVIFTACGRNQIDQALGDVEQMGHGLPTNSPPANGTDAQA